MGFFEIGDVLQRNQAIIKIRNFQLAKLLAQIALLRAQTNTHVIVHTIFTIDRRLETLDQSAQFIANIRNGNARGFCNFVLQLYLELRLTSSIACVDLLQAGIFL
ncbi:hypothetical protein D3C87_1555560 [compost metagenome]